MSTCLSPPSTPAHRLPGPPPRRPSALRRSSSSSSANSFVLHSVPRFSPDPVSSYFPPPTHDLASEGVSPSQSGSTTPATSRDDDVISSNGNMADSRAASTAAATDNSNSGDKHAARSLRAASFGGALCAGSAGTRPLPPRHAQSAGPGTLNNAQQQQQASSSSLLQRRKSSSSSAGRPAITLALSELESKLPTLKVPSPPLAKIPVDSLDKLDDTIPRTVIGESSAAVTPAMSDGTSPQERMFIEKPFRSTRTIVRTPFPERKSYLDDDEEQYDDDDDEKESTQKREVESGLAQ
ncbi:hypothetical protein ACM66B_001920 [Microbotryomycetes sp. NB124-2]